MSIDKEKLFRPHKSIISGGRTWLDLAKEYFPDKPDEFHDWVLWERTCFPYGSPDDVEIQLRQFKRAADSGGDVCEFCPTIIYSSSWDYYNRHCDSCFEKLIAKGRRICDLS